MSDTFINTSLMMLCVVFALFAVRFLVLEILTNHYRSLFLKEMHKGQSDLFDITTILVSASNTNIEYHASERNIVFLSYSELVTSSEDLGRPSKDQLAYTTHYWKVIEFKEGIPFVLRCFHHAAVRALRSEMANRNCFLNGLVFKDGDEMHNYQFGKKAA